MGGGLIPALIYSDDQRRRVQCVHCSHIFRQPRIPGSPIASFLGWLLALVIVTFIIAGFFFSFRDLASLLPSIPVISTIEEAVTMQPRVAAYLLAVLFVLIVIPCWIAALVSNIRFRKQFATNYQVKPLASLDLARKNTPQPELSSETRGA